MIFEFIYNDENYKDDFIYYVKNSSFPSLNRSQGSDAVKNWAYLCCNLITKISDPDDTADSIIDFHKKLYQKYQLINCASTIKEINYEKIFYFSDKKLMSATINYPEAYYFFDIDEDDDDVVDLLDELNLDDDPNWDDYEKLLSFNKKAKYNKDVVITTDPNILLDKKTEVMLVSITKIHKIGKNVRPEMIKYFLMPPFISQKMKLGYCWYPVVCSITGDWDNYYQLIPYKQIKCKYCLEADIVSEENPFEKIKDKCLTVNKEEVKQHLEEWEIYVHNLGLNKDKFVHKSTVEELEKMDENQKLYNEIELALGIYLPNEKLDIANTVLQEVSGIDDWKKAERFYETRDMSARTVATRQLKILTDNQIRSEMDVLSDDFADYLVSGDIKVDIETVKNFYESMDDLIIISKSHEIKAKIKAAKAVIMSLLNDCGKGDHDPIINQKLNRILILWREKAKKDVEIPQIINIIPGARLKPRRLMKKI